MSSTRRPLREIQNTKTPTRHEPSTPHAIRALQQRSGANTRTVRKRRAYSDTVRRDSARGILRQLAKITAPLTRKVIPTPATTRGKENLEPARNNSFNNEADERILKRPRLFIEGDDSFEDISPPDLEEEEDESELPVAPTPSLLVDRIVETRSNNGNDPTITFEPIDFASARPASKRTSQRHIYFTHDDEDVDAEEQGDEATILTELGRRAISEEPTGRLSRYSFGSIRMSDFGSELEVRRESNSLRQEQTEMTEPDIGMPAFDYDHVDFGGETEHVENLGKSPSPAQADDENAMSFASEDVSFQLELADKEATSSHAHSHRPTAAQHTPPVEDQDPAHVHSSVEMTTSLQKSPEAVAPHDGAEAAPRPRRKKLKMTRHGTVVPSLPRTLIKRVAIDAQARLGHRKPKLGREHMKALEQATEWYFEQVGEDLEAYSNHARRKKRIDRSDVLMLMRRQRVLQGDGELQKAALELLPEEAQADFEKDGL